LRSAQDVPIGNEPLLKLLYDGRMIEFYERFLSEPIVHFDYTWFRSKSAAHSSVSKPHCDVVYMSRGTTRNRYTSWTPLGDIPLGMGGLMILEGSHLQEELKATYGQTDVDVYCENIGDAAQIMSRAKAENRDLTADEKNNITWTTMGTYSESAADARDQVGGRWLTTDYAMGDLLVFGMYTMHTGHDNQTDRLRISTDTRYQPAADVVDERWVGTTPGNWDIRVKRGMIC
jgi:ectoine hydroxylase-related dioxygenase (phytanoyl-CoA dioxygenase family)